MYEINYSVHDSLNTPAKVDYLVAFGIRRCNAVTLVYSLARPYVFN